MTEKELLYIEDALGHLEHLQTICETYSQKLQDPQLVAFVKNIDTRCQNIKSHFMQVLGGCNNE